MLSMRHKPGDRLVFGQHRIRLIGIEPTMDCDAGPTLNRYWVGRPTLCVPGTSYRLLHWRISGCHSRLRSACSWKRHEAQHGCWPAPAMVVGGIGLHVEDMLVSLFLLIIISWTFRILAHEENQYKVYKILGQLFCLKHSNRLKSGLWIRELLF